MDWQGARSSHFFQVGTSNVLLAFIPDATLKGDILPSHGAKGPGHFALGIDFDEFGAWRRQKLKKTVSPSKRRSTGLLVASHCIFATQQAIWWKW
jgi:hypothetical protein